MFVQQVFLLVALVQVCFCSKRSDWTLISDAPQDAQIGFFLVLQQRNIVELQTFVTAVSSPRSPSYGHYMTKQQVAELIAPEREVADSVVAFVVKSCPSANVENRRDSVRVVASVSCVQRLLNVRLASFAHKSRPELSCVRLHDESFPPSLPPRVEHVFGLGMFPILRKQKKKPNQSRAGEFDFIDAAAINRLYNIRNNSVVPNSTIALIEFSPEGAPSPT